MNPDTGQANSASEEETVALGAMKKGMQGHILGFDQRALNGAGADMADRLREMGFAENLEIEVLHHSPFGSDPIAVRVGRMTVALRRREANIVKVQLV